MGSDSTEATRATSPAERARLLKDLALSEGFLLAGICAPDPSEHVPFLKRWLDAGRHGDMAYLARPEALARRGDLKLTLAEVQSVLCVAEPYHRSDPPGVPEDPRRGVIARYARGRDYHKVVEKRLRRVHRRFEEEIGGPVPARPYTDTGPILERELARRAGLGWFGKNTMLLHPREGSYFFLGVLLLGVDLEPDAPFEQDHCGSCHACLDACPTGALLGRDASGAPIMDATRCISYLTIEHRGPIEASLRPLIGNRIFGCDICQEVCPFNRRFAKDASDPAYAARAPGARPDDAGRVVEPSTGELRTVGTVEPGTLQPGTDGPLLLELIAMNREAWERFSRGSPIRRAGYAGFRRNVVVAIGNWLGEATHPEPAAIAALVSALSAPESLVRGHAAWALGQLGTEEAAGALRSRGAVESDPFVRTEVEQALALR